MRILHICSGIPLSAQGGVTNYVRSLATSQTSAGVEVFVLNSEEIEGYRVIKFDTKIYIGQYIKKSDYNSLLQLKEILDTYNFDLIHIHMCLNLDWDFPALLREHKYIVSLHDYFYLCPRIQLIKPGCNGCNSVSEKCIKCFSVIERNHFLRRLLKKIFNSGKPACYFPIKDKKLWTNWFSHYKPLLENASRVLPVSNRVKEIYESSGIKCNFQVLHIGNITAESFLKRTSFDSKKRIKFVILSQFSPIKGGDLICSLIEGIENDNIEFHFYGKANKKELKKMHKHGIKNHGRYNQQDLPNILKEMDIGMVVPVWEDNAPQVVMELLNSGIPVFGTKMGGIPDFVNETNGFLFDPFDDADVLKAKAFLNSINWHIIRKLSSGIKRTLTPKEHCNQLMDIYREIIEEE